MNNEFFDLLEKLVTGQDLDLININYSDFNTCINELNSIMSSVTGSVTSVHELFDELVKEIGGNNDD